jgi:hypothetical protein
MRPTPIAILILLSIHVNAQTASYKRYIALGDSKYYNNQFDEAAKYYVNALKSDTINYTTFDAFKCACALAHINTIDSSFLILFKLANERKFHSLEQLSTETALIILHTDTRWQKLITIVKTNQKQRNSNLNRNLAAVFDTIFNTDQQYRSQLITLQKKGVTDGRKLDNIIKKIDKTDSINLQKVTALINQHGWLGPAIIGDRGVVAEFLVIQHSPLPIQEKYFPLLQQAAEKGDLRKSDLAILQDRILVRKNKEQIYGSQIAFDNVTKIWFVSPLADPENVDQRRSEVGLPPIGIYVKDWDIKWNVNEYKQFITEMKVRSHQLN